MKYYFLGERYVYKFVCDPDALFQMALAENHRTALKMEATCIAASSGEAADFSASAAASQYGQAAAAAAEQSAGQVRSSRAHHHQYSDMLNQVYTSHLHAQLQQQTHPMHAHSAHAHPHHAGHQHAQRMRAQTQQELQEHYGADSGAGHSLEEYSHLQQLEHYAASVHKSTTDLGEDKSKNNNNNDSDNKVSEAATKVKKPEQEDLLLKATAETEVNSTEAKKSEHQVTLARNELLKKLRTTAASTGSGDLAASTKPEADGGRLFSYNSRL